MREIITFISHQESFNFLGNKNVLEGDVKDNDFGKIWNDFFDMGAYDPIHPYALDTRPINVWYRNEDGKTVYFQGLFVGEVDKVPDGFTLESFPEFDYLCITTEWMEDYGDSVGYEGNGRCNEYAEIAPIPDGWERCNGDFIKIEKENVNNPEGHRYEVWVPIRKKQA